MQTIKRSALALTLCAITACGGSNSATVNLPSGTPATTTTSGSPTTTLYGPLSSPELTLIGVDKDGNGVRDDVDSWIKTTFKDTPTQKAAITRAQWLTWAMLKGSRKTVTTEKENNSLAAASTCWYETAFPTLGPAMPSANQWEALLFNSYARAAAYLKWDATSSGIVREISAEPCADVLPVPVL
jgi:hypothetical protein